jgi:hypothetical protein
MPQLKVKDLNSSSRRIKYYSPRNTTIMKLAVLSTLVGSAMAFAPSSSSSARTPASTASTTMSLHAGEMSKSLPFLLQPPALDGTMVGDVGFDPLGFTNNFDIRWLREAELKHGRVSMLATVGFIASQFVSLPMFTALHVDDSNAAPGAVGTSAMLQIVLSLGIVEVVSNKGNITMDTMFATGTDRTPGDLGFDPLNYKKKTSGPDMIKLQMQELKNGRLAMLAIGGMIHHNFVTGEPLF